MVFLYEKTLNNLDNKNNKYDFFMQNILTDMDIDHPTKPHR